jgi:hypothetical protein
MKDNLELEQVANGEANSAAPGDSPPLQQPETGAASGNANADTTSKPATAGVSTAGGKPGRPPKKGSKANESAGPWEGSSRRR